MTTASAVPSLNHYIGAQGISQTSLSGDHQNTERLNANGAARLNQEKKNQSSCLVCRKRREAITLTAIFQMKDVSDHYCKCGQNHQTHEHGLISQTNVLQDSQFNNCASRPPLPSNLSNTPPVSPNPQGSSSRRGSVQSPLCMSNLRRSPSEQSLSNYQRRRSQDSGFNSLNYENHFHSRARSHESCFIQSPPGSPKPVTRRGSTYAVPTVEKHSVVTVTVFSEPSSTGFELSELQKMSSSVQFIEPSHSSHYELSLCWIVGLSFFMAIFF